ncbi:MAG TPA: mechanosensitive ion channel family protein [Methylophaga aminisulfidivorans]|nr:mechanosensitive ion channel family protein [Methylophaga sp.]HEC73729.1 mechanosensitive ion channel family protein [Methylophaga aminisulfidivorans]
MLAVKKILLKRLSNVINKTSFFYDTLILNSISFPLTLALLALTLNLIEPVIHYVGVEMDFSVLTSAARLFLVAALVLFIDAVLIGGVGHYADKSSSLKTSKSIMQGVVRALILGIGILVILGTMGISITPIIASLGITSLAVALALQPTLTNFFSGVQLVIDKPIRVGDFIELDSGEQGFVEKIGWRTTWIRMLQNNVIIIPNSVLSQSKIINYYYPEKQLSVPVEVGVHYDSDLEHVEQVTLEVAREILKTHKWGVEDYQTFVVFHTFDSSSINFTVMLRAQEYFNRFFIKSAFIKALHHRYRQEGITIPYPIRAINYQQEKSAETSID